MAESRLPAPPVAPWPGGYVLALLIVVLALLGGCGVAGWWAWERATSTTERIELQ